MTGRRRSSSRSLTWLLTAQAISLTGSRASLVAIPWLVLETTGSAARTGVVTFVEMLPYVLASALGGPLIDRGRPRRMSIGADLASVVAVGLVPILHQADLLPFAVLLPVIAVAGGLRGFGDTAKRVVFPMAVEASDVDMTRAAALHDGIDRLSFLLGGLVGGLLVAWLGAANAILVDAASFGFAAAIFWAGVRVAPAPVAAGPVPAAEPERYWAALRAGASHVRQDRLILGTVFILLTTNLLDQAHLGVLLPVWVHDVVGSPEALGLVFGAFGLGAVIGNIAFTALATRLPRAATFKICFLASGAPHILVMAASSSVVVVGATFFASGVLCAAINPILLAVTYERIPVHLRARVLGVVRVAGWAGVPLGGLLGGLAISVIGLKPALAVIGLAYLAITAIPLFTSTWRALDEPAREPSLPQAVAA